MDLTNKILEYKMVRDFKPGDLFLRKEGILKFLSTKKVYSDGRIRIDVSLEHGGKHIYIGTDQELTLDAEECYWVIREKPHVVYKVNIWNNIHYEIAEYPIKDLSKTLKDAIMVHGDYTLYFRDKEDAEKYIEEYKTKLMESLNKATTAYIPYKQTT